MQTPHVINTVYNYDFSCNVYFSCSILPHYKVSHQHHVLSIKIQTYTALYATVDTIQFNWNSIRPNTVIDRYR